MFTKVSTVKKLKRLFKVLIVNLYELKISNNLEHQKIFLTFNFCSNLLLFLFWLQNARFCDSDTPVSVFLYEV